MKKRMSALLLASAMTASLVTPAMAATEYDTIDSLDISISHDIEAGADEWEFEVSCDDKGTYFEEEDITVTNAPEEGEAWDEGDKPKATIKIRAEYDDHYKFDTGAFSKDNITLTVNGKTEEEAKVSYTLSENKKYMKLTVTLPKLKYTEGYWDDRLYIDEAEWGDDGVATWAENENAEGYEVRVYRGTKSLAGTLKTEETEIDLAEYFTSKGEYTFKVRAVYDEYKGEWEESDDLDLDKEEAADIYASASTGSTSKPSTKPSTSTTPNLPSYVVKGEWNLSKNGIWTFKDNNGVAYKNKWAAVYNPYANTAAGQQAFDWFYFDGNGEMVTGWILDGGRYYYCSELSDGTKGRMVTKWFQIGDAWYYFNNKSDGTRGAMLVNTWIGNDYVGENGKFDPNKKK